jgi:hypothetical protein
MSKDDSNYWAYREVNELEERIATIHAYLNMLYSDVAFQLNRLGIYIEGSEICAVQADDVKDALDKITRFTLSDLEGRLDDLNWELPSPRSEYN